MTVKISLDYDYTDVDDPSLQWQTGEITVQAEDGSELQALPNVHEGQGVRISVNGDFVDVPYVNVF